jgi:phosphoribosylcarboxyaminoimidazole (NCAIR) mutase
MTRVVQRIFSPPPPPPPPPVEPEPVVQAPTVTPDTVVKVGETEQDKRLKKVRTGAGRGARLSGSVLGSAPTTSKTLLGS